MGHFCSGWDAKFPSITATLIVLYNAYSTFFPETKNVDGGNTVSRMLYIFVWHVFVSTKAEMHAFQKDQS